MEYPTLELLIVKLLEGEENLELKVGDITATVSQHHKISGILQESRHQEHLEAWKRATDQGRCATHTSLHPSSNHWMNIGKYLSFFAYRLAIKGRLNLHLGEIFLEQEIPGDPDHNRPDLVILNR